MLVRRAEPRDYGAFARLFPELAIDDPVPPEDVFLREIMPTTLMLELAGEVAGLAHWVVLTGSGHLRLLITATGARRRGVGRTLMEAVRDVLRDAGCGTWTLNVLETNTAAVTLYEKMGLRRVLVSSALRVPWSAVDSMPEVAPVARAIAPGDDARVEAELGLSPGILALRRSQGGRSLLLVEEGGHAVAACAFDPSFPGAQPFFAPRLDLAIALLRAMKPHARPDHSFAFVSLDGQEDVARALVAHGAVLRFHTMRMRGPI